MQKVPFNGENLVFLDLEFSGLGPNDKILEGAIVVIPPIKKLLAVPNVEQCLQDHVDSFEFTIFQPASVLASMDAWNREHHEKSGLLDRVRSSKTTAAIAEQQALQFLREHLPAGKSPMCGNSIHKDRAMLARWMPGLEQFFYFQNLDLSSVARLIAERFQKNSLHTALSDTKESVCQYIHYQRMLASV
jgi:oligoribonuclease